MFDNDSKSARLAVEVLERGDGVFVLDREFRFVLVNELFERFSGRSRGELLGRTFWDLYPDAAHPESRFGRGYRRAMFERVVVRFEEYYAPHAIWYSVNAYPMSAGIAVFFRDITDRKRIEEELRAANERLVETDRRKSEFLALLSHELRNPLAPIYNSIFILETLPCDSVQARSARDVLRRQAEHLARLVDDLLDATRISRGSIQLQRTIVDLREVVRKTCEDHDAVLDRAGIERKLDLAPAPLWVDVDATRIAQAVGNLLTNATKFTPAHGSVTVRLRGSSGHAELSVRDTGIGMDPEQVAQMFEPFMQEERSLAHTRGGLGLGLAISKGLVELHGGTITARSDGPGRGAEFVMTLPLAAPVSDGTMPLVRSLTASSRRRVLLIDDNADAVRTFADVLETLGHEVFIAFDGTTGIALARERMPDVIVCDIGLPDVDGYEVARTLRRDDRLGRARLVALSGYGQPEDKQRAADAGFAAHFTRPVSLDALAAVLG